MGADDDVLKRALREAAQEEAAELERGLAELRRDEALRAAAEGLTVERGEVVVPAGWRFLDDAAHERIAARLSESTTPRPLVTVLGLRPIPRGRLGLALSLAAAVAGVLWIAPWRSDSLPGFELLAREHALESSVRFVRSGAGVRGAVDVLPDELVLKPSQAGAGAVEALVLVRRGETLRPWGGQIEKDPGGSVRLRGVRLSLEREEPGTVELLVAVGRPDVLPKQDELLAKRHEASPERGWVLRSLTIEIE